MKMVKMVYFKAQGDIQRVSSPVATSRRKSENTEASGRTTNYSGDLRQQWVLKIPPVTRLKLAGMWILKR